tara:strand:+ start:1660 stop:3495 length:1836 start_codon:yes stop_codon:yes gene_type:complete
MILLGISAFYHDSAAAIIINGKIIAAAQEERFTRVKHDSSYPSRSINYVLSEANINLDLVDAVIFYDKPLLKFERLLETYIALSPRGFNSFRLAMPLWLREKLFLKDYLLKYLKKIDKNFPNEKIFFSEHHLSHAASAFYASPYEKAVIITLDGVGEWASSSIAIGNKNKIEIKKEIHFPNSLGLFYSAFTYYIGFRVNSGEYKLMGLAPYGKPIYKNIIMDNIIDIKDDGSFRLDQSYFNYATGLTMVSNNFIKLFGKKVRRPDIDNLSQFHMDIAASVQAVTEEIIIKITRFASKEYGLQNLCLAGGVALNCVANGKILKDKKFKNIWIQPASGDAGGSVGAALAYWHNALDKPRDINDQDLMKGSFLGPKFIDVEIEDDLNDLAAIYKKLDYVDMIRLTAKAISEEKAIGWFQGRMEFGPRALGGRSILGDPRSSKTQKNLNLKVKYRESFRPFGPSILENKASEWFDINVKSPYMLLVAELNEKLKIKMTEKQKNLFGIEKLNVRKSEIPAVTHVDYSARLQTVSENYNKPYFDLITEFERITGCPILVNTSFNIRGEPIVCDPKDAFKCFMGTELDILVIGNYFLEKKDQKKIKNKDDYKLNYLLD